MKTIKPYRTLILWGALSLAAAALSGLLAVYSAYVGDDFRIEVERWAYIIGAIFYLILYQRAVREDRPWWKCGILAVLISAFYTVRTLFLNNLWEYLNFNSMFRWEDPLSYWIFLQEDLAYTEHYLYLKYPLLLAGMLLLCGLVLGFSRGWGRTVTHRLRRSVDAFFKEEDDNE